MEKLIDVYNLKESYVDDCGKCVHVPAGEEFFGKNFDINYMVYIGNATERYYPKLEFTGKWDLTKKGDKNEFLFFFK